MENELFFWLLIDPIIRNERDLAFELQITALGGKKSKKVTEISTYQSTIMPKILH